MSAPASARPRGARELLVEQRDFLLRSLVDLDAERAAGDIEESDYDALRDDYTRRAAEVLRRIARLDGREGEPGAGEPGGVGGEGSVVEAAAGGGAGPRDPSPEVRSRRRARLRLAVVASGVALCVGGAAWAAAAASGVRLPGQTITGSAIGPEKIAEEILAASKAAGRGDPVGALRDYQRVIAAQPDNPTALTGSAAILVESDQDKLVAQAAVMLAKAEHVDPSYSPAYLYLGRALILLGDYGAAGKQLRTFLADEPGGATAAEARKLLSYAEAHARKAGKAPSAP